MSAARDAASVRYLDNGSPARKVALRRWLLAQLRRHVDRAPRVLDCYGPYGVMHAKVWREAASSYAGTEGGAYAWLTSHDLTGFDLFDLDAYGSPYEALEAVAQGADPTAVIGVVATDGALRKEALYRANMPRFLQDRMKWPRRDDVLFAAIYYRYPNYARAVIERLTGRPLLHYAVTPSGRAGAVMYWAVVLGPGSPPCARRATPAASEAGS